MASPSWKSRPLTQGEIEMSKLVLTDKIDFHRVRLMREKAYFFQPRNTTMAPDGNIWFHPDSELINGPFADDFSQAPLPVRAHLIHELTHVMQFQQGVDLLLEKLLMFFRYGPYGGYQYSPGQAFESYNIEQQACIMEDHFRDRFSQSLG
ncbi:vgr related protein [Luteolibacter sp. AS25]|uniref:vgr related protein n=1 Tax=Luteolibacter sp. AS25 TaxID=3135776 RepID=UPI00398AA3C8